jgi:hypothetical protein
MAISECSGERKKKKVIQKKKKAVEKRASRTADRKNEHAST